VIERDDESGFTARYRDGPKAGLEIHFFAESELAALFAEHAPAIPLRLVRTGRTPPKRGQWSQWEAIWRKRC
jgi:hypothetical protein